MKKNLLFSILLVSSMITWSNEPEKQSNQPEKPTDSKDKQTQEQIDYLNKFKKDFFTWITANHPDFVYYDPTLQDMVFRLYMERRNNDLNVKDIDSLIEKYNENLENWGKYADGHELTPEEQKELDKIQQNHEEFTEEFAKRNLNFEDSSTSFEHMQNANDLIDQTQKKIAKFDQEANWVAFQQREKLGKVNIADVNAQVKAKKDVMDDVRYVVNTISFDKNDPRNFDPLKDSSYKNHIGKLANKYEEIWQNYDKALLPEPKQSLEPENIERETIE